MHDSNVVAFEIRRPWPQRSTFGDAKPGQRRWKLRLHHDCGNCSPAERAQHGHNPFPWWQPRSWTAFWTVAGRGFYFPALITVWHVEPGGKDSGEVCKHYRRDRQPDGKWKTTILHGWRWHAHHWRIQLHPLQALRRWALTRCAWCGGRQTKKDAVNVSHSWDGPRGRWWQGEPGLYHHDCSSIAGAHRICVCEQPICASADRSGSPYGACVRCGKGRAFGRDEAWIARQRVLAAVPEGQRDKAAYARVCEMYAAERLANEAEAGR